MMTPTSPLTRVFMQIDIPQAQTSHLRLVAPIEETERQPDPSDSSLPLATTSTSQSRPPIIPYKHKNVQGLIVLSQQAVDQGSIPGTLLPHLPRGPAQKRFNDDFTLIEPINPSPLHNLAFTNYSHRVNKRKSAIYYPEQVRKRFHGMPHAVSIAQTGFQALILCGPGIGLNTFTSVPHEYPKALIPIANRPMIWYVLDFCYRMGVTDITVVTPPASKAPIEAALAQNPDLTALPSPKPDLLAPADLEFNTPTAELLRLPEVQAVIKQDFLLLPCDLICEIPGEAFLESYLTTVAGIAGTGTDFESTNALKSRSRFALGAEGSGRRGGLSIWYNTVNREESVKKEECDFMCTVGLDSYHKTPLQKTADLPDGRLRKLVWTTPMSEVLEEAEEDKAWKVRQSLLRKYGSVKCMTQYRDSHIYFFPHWVKQFATQNEEFESVSEDLLGTWAKSEWRKPSYRTQLGVQELFRSRNRSTSMSDGGLNPRNDAPIEDEIDLLSLSSTQVTRHTPNVSKVKQHSTPNFASRVQPQPHGHQQKSSNMEDSMISSTTENTDTSDPNNDDTSNDQNFTTSTPYLPPILSYILPSTPSAPLLRRIDTTPLLLSTSLLLARLPSHDQLTSTTTATSLLSVPTKIHPTSLPPSTLRVSISPDTLIAPNTTLNQHASIKNSCIGSNCIIGVGARIQGCVIMDGAVIGEKCVLSGSVIGKRVVLGKEVSLKDCEVQDGMVLAEGVDGKGEKFLVGGFEEGDGGEGMEMYDNDDEEEDEEDEE